MIALLAVMVLALVAAPVLILGLLIAAAALDHWESR